MGYAKWIGGAVGWALGGPIGGVMGYWLGKMFSDDSLAMDGGRAPCTAIKDVVRPGRPELGTLP